MRFLPVESRTEFLVIAIKMVVKSQKLVGYFIPWNGDIPLLEKDTSHLCNDVRRFRGYIIFLRRSTSLSSFLLLLLLFFERKRASKEVPLRALLWSLQSGFIERRDAIGESQSYSISSRLREICNYTDYALDAPRRGYNIQFDEFFDSKEVLIFRNFALVPFRDEIGFDSFFHEGVHIFFYGEVAVKKATRIHFSFLRYLNRSSYTP